MIQSSWKRLRCEDFLFRLVLKDTEQLSVLMDHSASYLFLTRVCFRWKTVVNWSESRMMKLGVFWSGRALNKSFTQNPHLFQSLGICLSVNLSKCARNLAGHIWKPVHAWLLVWQPTFTEPSKQIAVWLRLKISHLGKVYWLIRGVVEA